MSRPANDTPPQTAELMTIFLCGDVMTGRGIDQVLPHPADPMICEPFMTSAIDYVALAETMNGPIPRTVGFSYIWGDALAEFERVRPDARIINLETAVTNSTDCVPKGINYKMNPENMPCITAAGIQCCTLANNHVLDWGYSGLVQTLETLDEANVKAAGAGRDATQARAPAIIDVGGKGRVVVLSFGSVTSGIPRDWAATQRKPGISLLPDLSARTVDDIAETVSQVKRPGDIVVASLHWGGNWGYRVPARQREFAHRLIDDAQVDVVHGHSSHHPKGIEVHGERPILYGCGDLLNDYEGISGYEDYRDDLVLMYFVSLAPSSGRLVHFEMRPLQIKNFKLSLASQQDCDWLRNVLDRECLKVSRLRAIRDSIARREGSCADRSSSQPISELAPYASHALVPFFG